MLIPPHNKAEIYEPEAVDESDENQPTALFVCKWVKKNNLKKKKKDWVVE